MKKFDLVHSTILIVAILTGYTAFESILYLFSSIAYSTDSVYVQHQLPETFLYSLLVTLTFSVICVILVRNARKYAAMLLKDEPEAGREDLARLPLDQRNLLLVLFIGMGLYSLIQYLPYVIRDSIDFFQQKINAEQLRVRIPNKGTLVVELLRVTIGAFLLYAAPTLADFTIKHIAGRLKSESETL
jgi:hypothetical protein